MSKCPAHLSTVGRCVWQELERYLETLGDQAPSNLHQMVLGEAEQAVLLFVLELVEGNQSRAAQMLGINRGTLRKKLREIETGS